jgi:HSP20 family protein
MALDLIPRSFLNLPRMSSIFDDIDNWQTMLPSSGLSVSEDENHVYVEAAVPGVDPDQIEVTYDKGVLWIKGSSQQEEQDKNKKFYRKAANTFSYHVTVPGTIDESKEPEAICKNGVMKVIFDKMPEVQPKKLNVKKA